MRQAFVVPSQSPPIASQAFHSPQFDWQSAHAQSPPSGHNPYMHSSCESVQSPQPTSQPGGSGYFPSFEAQKSLSPSPYLPSSDPALFAQQDMHAASATYYPPQTQALSLTQSPYQFQHYHQSPLPDYLMSEPLLWPAASADVNTSDLFAGLLGDPAVQEAMARAQSPNPHPAMFQF